MHCRVFSPVPGLCILDARSTPFPSCDKPKCSETLSWREGSKIIPVEKLSENKSGIKMEIVQDPSNSRPGFRACLPPTHRAWVSSLSREGVAGPGPPQVAAYREGTW